MDIGVPVGTGVTGTRQQKMVKKVDKTNYLGQLSSSTTNQSTTNQIKWILQM